MPRIGYWHLNHYVDSLLEACRHICAQIEIYICAEIEIYRDCKLIVAVHIKENSVLWAAC